jgi:MOSC domain-containing protein YiiM
VDRVSVGADGVDGDRYANGTGTFFRAGKSGQALTLISSEALVGLPLSFLETGRNVLTSGVDLNALVGRSFRVGSVWCVGDRLCDPCRVLERRTAPGVMRALAGRGGLRADVVEAGEIAVGDALVVPPPS